MADFQLNVKIGGVESTVSTIGEIETALRKTREELRNVEIGSTAFEELGTQAGNLQRELQNSFKEVVNFDRSIGQLGESVSRIGSTITAGFTIATSAIGFFGDESEELSKAQIKAQQALALAISATTLATNAKKLSEDLKNISEAIGLQITNERTTATNVNTTAETANTIATEANVVATEAQVVATETATVATRGFTAALLSNPLTAILVGLTAVIGALVLFSDEEEKAKTAVVESNDVLEEQIDKLKEAGEIRRDIADLNSELAKLGLKSERERAEEEVRAAKTRFEDVQRQLAVEKVLLEIRRQDLDIQRKLAENLSSIGIGFTAEQQKAFEASKKRFDDTEKAIDLLEKRSLDSQVKLKTAENDFTKFQDDENKKRINNLRAYSDAQLQILDKIRNNTIQLTRAIEDEAIESAAASDDVIAQLDKDIQKVKVNRKREIGDAFADYLQDLENFRKTAKEKGITGAKLKEDELEITQAFDIQLALINEKFNNLEISAEQAKAKKIKIINDALVDEISFGDNNLYDTKKRQIADAAEFELNTIKNNLANQKALRELNLLQFTENEDDKINVLLQAANKEQKARLSKQTETLKKQRDAEIQELNTQKALALFSIQGLEEQKNIERENLTKQFEQKKQQIEEKFRQDYKNAEIATAQEVFRSRLQVANQILQVTNTLLSSLDTINSEYSKLQQDRQQSELNDIIDTAQAEIDAQKKLFDEGIINKEQYDAKINEIQKRTDANKLALDDKFAEESFKRQKRLALANAGVLIAQSILQALGSLPAPYSYISAGISAAAGAVQLALIAKQEYRGSNDKSTSLNTGLDLGGTGVNTGAAAVQQSTAGGFTQFNQNLVGTPNTGSFRTATQQAQTIQRVVVVESDITNAQRRVRVLENNSTFG